VICAGLDLDYKAKPFGHIPELLAIADDVYKIKAICTVCGQPATRSQRLSLNNTDVVLVGEKDSYEARCRAHYDYEEKETELEKEIENQIEKEDKAFLSSMPDSHFAN